MTGDINTPTPKTVSLSQLNWKNGKVKFEATKLFIVLGKFEATIAVLGWVAWMLDFLLIYNACDWIIFRVTNDCLIKINTEAKVELFCAIELYTRCC